MGQPRNDLGELQADFSVEVIILKGSLPSPCQELRLRYTGPDFQNRIKITLYSVVDINKNCTAELVTFEHDIHLGTLPAGHYTVFVNGNQVNEFNV